MRFKIPNPVKRLELAVKKCNANLRTQKTTLLDTQIILKDGKKIKLEGCTVLTDNKASESILIDCSAKEVTDNVQTLYSGNIDRDKPKITESSPPIISNN